MMPTRARSSARWLVPTLVMPALLFLAGTDLGAQMPQRTRDELEHRAGFTWRTATGERFDLFYEPGSPAERRLPELMETGERSVTKVLELLGERSSSLHVDIFLVDSRARMGELIGWETNGQAFRKTRVVCHVVADTFSSFGTHELMHVAATNLWGWDDNTPEEWINEGLAVYAGDRWHDRPLHPLAKHLREHGELLSLKELTKGFSRHPVMVTYPEAGSLIKHVYETYGREKLKALWDTGASGAHRVLGKGWRSIEDEWLAVVERADSSSISYDIQK